MSLLSMARIGDLVTQWTLMTRAHMGSADDMALARAQLLGRYMGAAYQYLLGAVRDAEKAEELTQEFALNFLRGDFRHAHPEHGRFRDYLRSSLARLVSRHRRRDARGPLPLTADFQTHFEREMEMLIEEEAFTRGWRETLLARAWDDLARLEFETGQPVHTVLRLRVNHPDWRSQDLAVELMVQLGKPMTAEATRQALHRAREKFADFLLEAVAQSLDDPDGDRLAEELQELNLLDYCRAALSRRTPI